MNVLQDPASGPKYWIRAPTFPIKVEGNVNIAVTDSSGFGVFLQFLEGFPGIPAFSIQSLPLICCEKLFIQCLVVSQSNCYIYICKIYMFDFAHGKG